MSLPSTLVSQFGRPTGPLGRLVGHVMAAKSDNRTRGRWTVDLLDLAPTDRVLELGYGPGVVTGWLCDEVPHGRVVGVDHSAAMCEQAVRRNRTHVRSGRLELLVGDAEDLPADLGPFDAACAMNVWQFWHDPEATFAAIGATLTPGGRLAITYLPPTAGARSGEEAAALITSQMSGAGLVDPRTERLAIGSRDAVCVLAGRADRRSSEVNPPGA